MAAQELDDIPPEAVDNLQGSGAVGEPDWLQARDLEFARDVALDKHWQKVGETRVQAGPTPGRWPTGTNCSPSVYQHVIGATSLSVEPWPSVGS